MFAVMQFLCVISLTSLTSLTYLYVEQVASLFGRTKLLILHIKMIITAILILTYFSCCF